MQEIVAEQESSALKTTLNGIPKEQVKKMVEDIHNKDYLAIAMGV